MVTNVIAKIEIDGLHNWPDAQSVFPEVGFLASMHRHKWYITAKKRVNHDDRDVEFILFKRWLEGLYDGTLELNYNSCEMIADDLHEEITEKYPKRKIWISVSEDNENGCIKKYK